MLIQSPSLSLLMAEGSRSMLEAFVTAVTVPFSAKVQGDGSPVIVVPGFLAGDGATSTLRSYLNASGYVAHGWEQGTNTGLHEDTLARLDVQIHELFCKYGPVNLVGWSLGGVFARVMANRLPHLVRNVVTMGTPLHGGPKVANGWQLYGMINGQSAEGCNLVGLAQEMTAVPGIRTTSIYSKSDGVVAWEASVEPAQTGVQAVQVHSSHMGLTSNLEALQACSKALQTA